MTQITDSQKPIPVPDEASKPFFDGAREHKLMVQKCAACSTVMWPVKPRCNNCLSEDLMWTPVSGKGTLYSFTLMHQVFHPGFAAEVPYNIAEVDLEEGLRIITNIVGCDNADLQIGMPLEATFEDVTDEVTLPKFKPADTMQ
ncbi:MAG TPA: Zn-ribbon domain-containing OB-fold protein [Ktedonobacteraceae bacterium]|nr:Zn-ribbon domain-containing OB-fold protein [Ktedonobacteraceae bacterium]